MDIRLDPKNVFTHKKKFPIHFFLYFIIEKKRNKPNIGEH